LVSELTNTYINAGGDINSQAFRDIIDAIQISESVMQYNSIALHVGQAHYRAAAFLQQLLVQRGVECVIHEYDAATLAATGGVRVSIYVRDSATLVAELSRIYQIIGGDISSSSFRDLVDAIMRFDSILQHDSIALHVGLAHQIAAEYLQTLLAQRGIECVVDIYDTATLAATGGVRIEITG